MTSQKRLWFVIAVTLTFILMIPCSSIAQTTGETSNGWIVPPGDSYAGLTYGEWQAEWWKWATLLPASHHPLADTSDCSTGQSGPVWYLGGLFCSSFNACDFSAIHRTCKVPRGKALLVPILNGEMSFVEDFSGAQEPDLRSGAKFSGATVSASIDGLPVKYPERFQLCKSATSCTPQESPLFTLTLAPYDNIWGQTGETVNNEGARLIPDGWTTQAVGDGYYLLIKPLPFGHHVIKFDGVFGQFELHATYDIYVTK